MKRFMTVLVILIFIFMASVACADPARYLKKDKDNAYHSTHLYEHIGSKNCKVSTNYVKVWNDVSSKKVLGHLEQADTFTLDEIDGDYAKITVTRAAKTSKDSHDGLTGWVDANYVECPCSSEEYYNGPAHTTYSIGVAVKDKVNLREEPSKESTLFASLSKGEQVEILSEYTGKDKKIWYRCRYEGKMGFIRNDMLEITERGLKENSVGINASSSSDSDGLWGDVHLNEAEIAATTLSYFLGDPRLANLGEGSSTFDEINSRYIFIGSKDLLYDLCVIIRVNDRQGYFWGMDLTPENLVLAKLAFREDAPSCYLAYYDGNELKDSAGYYKDFNSIMPYDKFEEKVDSIVASLSSGDMSKTSDLSDPILSGFSGLSWYMTKSELMATAKTIQFTDLSSEDGISLAADVEVFGDKVLALFVFADNSKLSFISTWITEEKKDQYIDGYKQVYGTPVQTTYTDALVGKIGKIKEDLSGECFAWKTDKSLIVLNGSSIEYWPLY